MRMSTTAGNYATT